MDGGEAARQQVHSLFAPPSSALVVKLPTLHADQIIAYEKFRRNRFVAIRCGRRWGKTKLELAVASDFATRGKAVGWFAPNYKMEIESYNNLAEMLAPIEAASSKTEGLFRTISGGRVDFWTLENEDAGRSRDYDLVLVDEGAFTKPNTMNIWQRAIRPTLMDRRGRAMVASNARGIDSENFFWQICNEEKHGFVQHHAPTGNNPHIPADEVEEFRKKYPALVYQQEIEAEFVDWSGASFFALDKLLLNREPYPWPESCDAVFAIIDTASKTGTANDGTAVAYYAYSVRQPVPLLILDWDINQIEGDLLEVWLPTVFKNLEAMARKCGARRGSLGAWIEDANSGTVLIQKALRKSWPVRALPEKLRGLGKDGRAIAVSSDVHQEKVKFTPPAYNKVTVYKETSRNHMVSQVVNFRVGDKDNAKRPDDLLDTFTYGILVSLGTTEGI